MKFDGMQDRLSRGAEAFDLDGDLVFRPMFGGVSASLSGRVFASLSDVGLALKLPPEAQEELLRVPGAHRLQYEADSPPSKQYIVVPPAVQSDQDAWRTWFKKSADYVLSLPTPKPKPRKPSA